MEFVVYSKKLANKLIDNGFKLLRCETNFKYPQYKVFVFEKTTELLKYLNIK